MNNPPVKLLCLSYLLLGQVGCLRSADELIYVEEGEEGEAQRCASGEGGDVCDGASGCSGDLGEGCAPCQAAPEGCPDLNFIRIEGGSFMMGSAEGASNEQPVHSVSVATFEITATEVTVAQYRACVEAGRCSQPNAGHEACTWNHNPGEQESHPVNCVHWGQARTFAKWVGADVDLPTEAEWAYAARGGEDFKYAGSDDIDEVAWYRRNSSSTQPVGMKERNGYGLYDMSGNLLEWVLDEYHPDYVGAPGVSGEVWGSMLECNQECATGSALRVVRGGGWFYDADELHVTVRDAREPSTHGFSLGFRLRRSLP